MCKVRIPFFQSFQKLFPSITKIKQFFFLLSNDMLPKGVLTRISSKLDAEQKLMFNSFLALYNSLVALLACTSNLENHSGLKIFLLCILRRPQKSEIITLFFQLSMGRASLAKVGQLGTLPEQPLPSSQLTLLFARPYKLIDLTTVSGTANNSLLMFILPVCAIQCVITKKQIKP